MREVTHSGNNYPSNVPMSTKRVKHPSIGSRLINFYLKGFECDVAIYLIKNGYKDAK
jgi:hypothetical protein